MITDIHSGNAGRLKMQAGVNKLADAVKITLGPKGRNVAIRVLKPDAAPKLTKDGAEVARSISHPDKIEDMGAQLVKEAALKTMFIAGDGTTTATILANEIINNGMKWLEQGANPVDLKKGIDKAVACVVEYIAKQSIPIAADGPELKEIAYTSCNGDEEMSEIIGNTMKQIGVDGHIWLHKNTSGYTSVEVMGGINFPQGYVRQQFITNVQKGTAELDDAYILIYDKKISAIDDIRWALDLSLSEHKPILIMAEDIDGEALATMITNKVQAGTLFAAVKTPSAGVNQKEFLEDLATYTGGKLITEEEGKKVSKADKSYLGRAGKIIITKESTTIKDGKGSKDELKKRVIQIRSMIKDSRFEMEKERQRLRLARLTDGIALLSIGAASDIEMEEKYMRADDAIKATRGALEEGIMPGGGIIFFRAVQLLELLVGENEDQTAGIEIVINALKAPIRQIFINAAVDPEEIFNTIQNSSSPMGYNAKTGAFEDLLAAGVIDPAKVARVALENAASVGAMFLMTEVVISDY
jgi:chaperonin GroEL